MTESGSVCGRKTGGVEVGTRSRVDENGLSCKCVNVEVYNKAGGTLMTI